MAKINYYILSHGKLVRKHNTVYFYSVKDGEVRKNPIPIKKIHAIYIIGRVSLSSGVIHYLSRNRIPVHFFNKYGIYLSSLYPRKYLLSGYLLVKQVEKYIDYRKRLEIAREIVKASISNMMRNLDKHSYIDSFKEEKSILRSYISQVDEARRIDELMGIEGNARHEYYKTFNKILRHGYTYSKRSRRPPETKLDSLISFGNTLLYATVLSEIYHTQLDPTISYLHKPSERRYSLALDISEIFKPLIVDRVIFKLVNKNMLDESDFNSKINYIMLSESGKRKFLKEYENRLRSTVRHRTLRRNVSMQRLIRLECYKLMKHLIDASKYKGLVAWW